MKVSEIIIAEIQRKAELIDGLPRLSGVRVSATIDRRTGQVKMRIQPEIDCGTVGARGES